MIYISMLRLASTPPYWVGEETVDTLNGKVKLKVKPETQNGTKVPFERQRLYLFCGKRTEREEG